MKLATLKSARRDGSLAVVSRDLRRAITVADIARTLQAAIDDWDALSSRLRKISDRLNNGEIANAIPFDPTAAASPPSSVPFNRATAAFI